MKTIKIIGTVLIGAAIAFAAGRYTATLSKTDTKVDEIKNTTTHQEETTTTVKKPDGTVTTVTKVDTVTSTKDQKDTEVLKETVPTSKSKLNISALVATSIHEVGVPAYGISVSKEFIGPITVGAFGLTNGTLGVSIGLNF